MSLYKGKFANGWCKKCEKLQLKVYLTSIKIWNIFKMKTKVKPMKISRTAVFSTYLRNYKWSKPWAGSCLLFSSPFPMDSFSDCLVSLNLPMQLSYEQPDCKHCVISNFNLDPHCVNITWVVAKSNQLELFQNTAWF